MSSSQSSSSLIYQQRLPQDHSFLPETLLHVPCWVLDSTSFPPESLLLLLRFFAVHLYLRDESLDLSYFLSTFYLVMILYSLIALSVRYDFSMYISTLGHFLNSRFLYLTVHLTSLL